MNEISTITKQTMSSLEIAELTGKRHDHVLRDIRQLLHQLEDSPKLGSGFKTGTYVAGNGKNENCFNLDYDSTTCLLTGYDAKSRMVVIKRWQELESKSIVLPDFTNPAIAARAWADEVEAKFIAQAENEKNRPKVEFAEKVRALDGSISVGDFAKLIGTGQNRLFKRLRDDGFLMINNHPMQSAVERDLLVQVEGIPYTDSNNKSHPAFQTRITGKGQVYFEKKYRVSFPA